ncbi:MAG TPA: hypothetical protein VFR46_07200 [Actinomycetes bacterium]|nr:hypothetical protein [Actinomycetes bacterium]
MAKPLLGGDIGSAIARRRQSDGYVDCDRVRLLGQLPDVEI